MIYYWLQERFFTRIAYGWKETDLKRRSFLKAVLYKLFSLITSFTVGYIVLGNIEQAGVLTVIKHITALVDFYLFERLWNRISWGRSESSPT
jgi:uncharacterized membrane protein